MKVFARVRPATADQPAGGFTTISEEEKKVVATCFGGDATQHMVNNHLYSPMGLDEAVSKLCTSSSPYQALFIAYGQTGSGKTHTMLGPPGCLTEANVAAANGTVPDSWGLFPATAGQVVAMNAATSSCFVTVSAVEIYMNSLFDLLNNRAPIKVEGASVRATSRRMEFDNVTRNSDGKWVPPSRWSASKEQDEDKACSTSSSAREIRMVDMADVAKVARTVEIARSAQKHSLNDRSSRSHCLITLKVEHVDAVSGRFVTSSVVFGDLAGSERIYKSGVAEDYKGGARKFSIKGHVIDLPSSRLDEARAINNSLASLGRVLNSVARRDKFVSYRDTTLTQVLKPMLESRATDVKVVLALSDAFVNNAECRSTLRFGGSLLATQQGGRTGRPATTAASKSQRSQSVAAANVSSASSATLQSKVKELQAICDQFQTQLAAMQRDGRAGHVVVAPEFPAPTRQAFLDNKAKLEAANEQIRLLKASILERKSVLQLRAKSNCNSTDPADCQSLLADYMTTDATLLGMMQSLKFSQEEKFIAEGIYFRQLTTGIWAAPSPQYELVKIQLETQLMRLEFFSAAIS